MKLSLGKCWGLLIFDMISLALSGYAFLLGFQILETLPNANAFIILMGFFVGIKIIVLSIYDLNKNLLLKNIPFIAALISIIGNGIVFGVCWFLVPDVPLSFFIGLTLSDFIMILLAHFLWWVIIGRESQKSNKQNLENKGVQEKQELRDQKNEESKSPKNKRKESKTKRKSSKKDKNERKSWLNQADEEESEYDSIFTALLENEKKTEKNPRKLDEIDDYDHEKRYQTSEFLKDIQLNLEKEHQENGQQKRTQSGNDAFRVEPIEKNNPKARSSANQDQRSVGKTQNSPKLEVSFDSENPQKKQKPKKISELFDSNPEDDVLLNANFVTPEIKEKPLKKEEIKPNKNDILKANNTTEIEKDHLIKNDQGLKRITMNQEEKSEPKETLLKSDDDFIAVERRLNYLFSDIQKSMKETEYLQGAVAVFHEEIENYTSIAGDDKIIATGNLIREKLKAIIDKQFVVDEVLDDLIRLSKLINNRIDDLDVIEAGLNQRKVVLDQKEVLRVDNTIKDITEGDIEIMPKEIILENLDSEFIVDEEDYEMVRKYLTQNQEKNN
jgi:hypothetical protein